MLYMKANFISSDPCKLYEHMEILSVARQDISGTMLPHEFIRSVTADAVQNPHVEKPPGSQDYLSSTIFRER